MKGAKRGDPRGSGVLWVQQSLAPEQSLPRLLHRSVGLVLWVWNFCCRFSLPRNYKCKTMSKSVLQLPAALWKWSLSWSRVKNLQIWFQKQRFVLWSHKCHPSQQKINIFSVQIHLAGALPSVCSRFYSFANIISRYCLIIQVYIPSVVLKN